MAPGAGMPRLGPGADDDDATEDEDERPGAAVDDVEMQQGDEEDEDEAVDLLSSSDEEEDGAAEAEAERRAAARADWLSDGGSDASECAEEDAWHPRRDYAPASGLPASLPDPDALASRARRDVLERRGAPAGHWTHSELACLGAMFGGGPRGGDGSAAVCKVADQTLSCASLFRMLPGQWLDDQCMNVWVSLIRRRAAGAAGHVQPRSRRHFRPDEMPPPASPPLAALAPCAREVVHAVPRPLDAVPSGSATQDLLKPRDRYGWFDAPPAPPVGARRLGLVPRGADPFGRDPSSTAAASAATSAAASVAASRGYPLWPRRRRAGCPRTFVAQVIHLWRLSLNDAGAYDYETVRRWTRRQGVDVRHVQRCVFPVNVTPTHWAVVLLDLERRRVEYLDSLAPGRDEPPAPGSRGHRLCTHALRWLRDECAAWPDVGGVIDTSTFTAHVSARVPRQLNGYDCGVFAMWVTECLSLGLPLDWTQADVDAKRWDMVRQFARHAPCFDEEELGRSEEEAEEEVVAEQALEREEDTKEEGEEEAEEEGGSEASREEDDDDAIAAGRGDDATDAMAAALRRTLGDSHGALAQQLAGLIGRNMGRGDPAAVADAVVASVSDDVLGGLASAMRRPS